MNRTENEALIRRVIKASFWLPEYRGCFSEDFVLECPNAPAGMPTRFENFELENYFVWLTETVKTWTVTINRLHATPNPEEFWVVYNGEGDVRWALVKGHFESLFAVRILVKDGKIAYMKQLFNPLAFLDAIGRSAPIFHVDTDDERVSGMAEELRNGMLAPVDYDKLDLSPEAVRNRINRSLMAYGVQVPGTVGEPETLYGREFNRNVYFLPPEMKDGYEGEESLRMDAWGFLGCDGMEFDPYSVAYPLDDDRSYFIETGVRAGANWIGNNVVSHYRNRYFFFVSYDEAGCLKREEEYMNPINKFNSINVSIPTFPYFGY